MTQKLVTLDIKGIKCDNTECDYQDMEVEFDPEKYLNAPCPKCGSNLFTQADYDSLNKILKVNELLEKIIPENIREVLETDKKLSSVRMQVNMNGTGEIKINKIERLSK